LCQVQKPRSSLKKNVKLTSSESGAYSSLSNTKLVYADL
jgi:hypothetical protein